MKLLIHALILVSVLGMTFLFATNREHHGKSVQKPYDTHKETLSGNKHAIDVPPEEKADTSVPAIDDIVIGKKMKYWIY